VRSLSAAVVVISLVLISSVGLVPGVASPEQQGPYVFYGYAPIAIFNYTRVVDNTLLLNYTRVPSRLDIIGINDSTRVEVYNLTDRSLMASKTINRMGLWTLYLGTSAQGTSPPSGQDVYFKVVSDKLVSVLLQGGRTNFYGTTMATWYEDEGFSAIYPSTDGGFFGKEFIFMTTNACWSPVIYVLEKELYHVFGIENAHVTFYDASGAVAATLDVSANSFGTVHLRTQSVYRAVSTGRIMLAGLNMGSFMYLPSLTGGFEGRSFIGTMPGSIYVAAREFVVAEALEDADVRLFDLRRPGMMIALTGPDVRKSLRAGEHWVNSTMKTETPLRIESSGNITVLFGRGGIWAYIGYPVEPLGDDITFLGARAGETLSFYVPTQGVIFAPQDMTIEIDGVATTMRTDDHYTLLSGVHTIRSTAPTIVEVLGWGSDTTTEGGRTAFSRTKRGTFDNYGSYLLTVQSLELTYPPPAPIGGIAELIPIIGGVAAVVVIIVALLVVRRRAKPAGREG